MVEIRELALLGIASVNLRADNLPRPVGFRRRSAPGLVSLRLVVEPEATAPTAARALIAWVRTAPLPDTEQMRLLELIETIVVYTCRRSRQEIAAMLGLTDLKEAQFYQETRAESLRPGHTRIYVLRFTT